MVMPLRTCPVLDALANSRQFGSCDQFPASCVPNPTCRSFQGLTCLIQISTRQRHFLIDALACRRWIGPALAPAFIDPSILKVMHGSHKDMEWL